MKTTMFMVVIYKLKLLFFPGVFSKPNNAKPETGFDFDAGVLQSLPERTAQLPCRKGI